MVQRLPCLVHLAVVTSVVILALHPVIAAPPAVPAADPRRGSPTWPTVPADPLTALFDEPSGHWVHTADGTPWYPSDLSGSRFVRDIYRWQPAPAAHCPHLARLPASDILRCLANHTLTLWGDSTARVLYYGLIHQLAPALVTDKHANRVLTFAALNASNDSLANATFEFRWDPVLGSNSFSSFRPFLSTGRLPPLLLLPPSSEPDPPRRPPTPTLILFSAGLWYIDPRPGMYPLARFPQFQTDVRALLALAARLRLASTALVLVEVERPVQEKDIGGWHPADEVDEANAWLRQEFEQWKDGPGQHARTRVVLASVFNAMIANLSANTPDGLHYDLDLAQEQADVLLSVLCGPCAQARLAAASAGGSPSGTAVNEKTWPRWGGTRVGAFVLGGGGLALGLIGARRGCRWWRRKNGVRVQPLAQTSGRAWTWTTRLGWGRSGREGTATTGRGDYELVPAAAAAAATGPGSGDPTGSDPG